MKVTVRQKDAGGFSVYIPKKDLEAAVVSSERPSLWGGRIELQGGMVLELPVLPDEQTFPVTVEARRVDSDGSR